MTLKELTQEKHRQAESTPFMQAVFNRNLPLKIWANFTYNKMIFYAAIEAKARSEGFMNDLSGLDRAYLLYQDFKLMNQPSAILPSAIAYLQYILDLEPGKVLAHLYTWHMGDLHGGQMIKRMIDAPHGSLEFDNKQELIDRIRSKLDITLAQEANVAFDWAIRIMNEYDHELSNN